MIMEKKEPQQESNAIIILRKIEQECKRLGLKHTIREPNREVFTVSFKKKSDS